MRVWDVATPIATLIAQRIGDDCNFNTQLHLNWHTPMRSVRPCPVQSPGHHRRYCTPRSGGTMAVGYEQCMYHCKGLFEQALYSGIHGNASCALGDQHLGQLRAAHGLGSCGS